jgi:hypothetical protein
VGIVYCLVISNTAPDTTQIYSSNTAQLVAQRTTAGVWHNAQQQLDIRSAVACYAYVVCGMWYVDGIPFEQKETDYLLWGCFRSSFASSSTPAGCLLQLIHGLDEGARGAKSP